MIRWLSVVALAPLVGCQWLGLSRDDFGRIANREIAVPKMPAASVEAAVRVNKIGLQLSSGSPFIGIEPNFDTIGTTEPELFHRDSTGLFITEGLVNLCRKDEELAAVLAHEMGLMAAEMRRTDRMKRPDPLPSMTWGKPDGSTDMNPGRDMYLADFEKNVRKPSERSMWPVTDAKKIARQILTDAGYAEKWLDDAQPILKQANRTQEVAKQLGGRSAPPRWSP